MVAERDPVVQLDRARSPAAVARRISVSWRDGAASGLRQRKRLADLAFLFSTSATQLLSERFESEHVKAALGWHAINDSVAGPSTPGTAYVLLHDHASEEAEGGVRQWGFVRGGMGRLTAVMADAAREAGCTIRCEAEVARVRTTRRSRDRRATRRRRGDPRPPRALQRRSEAHVPDAVRPWPICRPSSSRGSRRTGAWARASR